MSYGCSRASWLRKQRFLCWYIFPLRQTAFSVAMLGWVRKHAHLQYVYQFALVLSVIVRKHNLFQLLVCYVLADVREASRQVHLHNPRVRSESSARIVDVLYYSILAGVLSFPDPVVVSMIAHPCFKQRPQSDVQIVMQYSGGEVACEHFSRFWIGCNKRISSRSQGVINYIVEQIQAVHFPV